MDCSGRLTAITIGFILATAACDEAPSGRIADEPCEDDDECVGLNPTCIDLGDGVPRCQSMCLGDRDCGKGAACLFPGGETPGLCWRTCDDVEDCASGTWACSPIVDGSDEGYCEIALE